MEPLSRPIRRVLTGMAVGALAVVLAPGAASAHVDGQEVEAGTEATVPFHVGHGCDGEATTKLEIQVPPEATDPQPGDVDGWEGSVDDQIVTFDGGELPDDEEMDFPVTFQAPSTPMTLYFPVVQTCGDLEIAWVSEDPDADYPAPVVEVVAGGEGTATTEPEATATTEDTSATTDDTATTTTVPTTTDDAAEDDDDDSSPLVPILIGVAAIAVVGGGAYAFGKSKKDDGTGDAPGSDGGEA